MGNSTTGSLRAAFVAGVNTWANGPQSINASSALQAMDIIDPETAKYLNFAMNGVNPDDWAGTAMSAMHEVKNHYAQEEMARFAKRNGMNLGELNALLTLNSELGNSFGGDGSWSRYDSEKNLMKDFMNRGDSFMENLAGAIWDINDYMLGVQGLLDASGRDYMSSKNAGQHITDCHSLGSITCNNLVARGHAPSARLNSLPMVLVPNFSHGNNMRQTYFGSGDPINLFGLGDFFNPFSHQIDQSNSSCLLMGCHNFDPNYLHGGG